MEEREAKQEEQHYVASRGMLMLFLTNVLLLSIAITALVLGQRGDPPCAHVFMGIRFDFATWLCSYGVMGCIITGLNVIPTLCIMRNYSRGFVFNQMTCCLHSAFMPCMACSSVAGCVLKLVCFLLLSKIAKVNLYGTLDW